jgi:hypothetical protein
MSLEEIPDTVYVALGSRGFHPVHPKQCAKCGNDTPTGFELLQKREQNKVEYQDGYNQIIDYKIQCRACNNIFYVRLQHFFQQREGVEERLTTQVNILDAEQNDLGWLGSY